MESHSHEVVGNKANRRASDIFSHKSLEKIDEVDYQDHCFSSNSNKFSIDSMVVVPFELNNYNSNNSDIKDGSNLSFYSQNSTSNILKSKIQVGDLSTNYYSGNKAHKKNSRSDAGTPLICHSNYNKVNNSIASLDIIDDLDKLILNPELEAQSSYNKNKESKLTLNMDNLDDNLKKINLSSKNKKVNIFHPHFNLSNSAYNPHKASIGSTNNYSYSNKELNIKGSVLKIIKRLGKGTYGSVYLIQNPLNYQNYAMKKYTNCMNKDDVRLLINSQVEILKNLKHSSLPKVYDAHFQDKMDFIILEYFPLSLEQLISLIFHPRNNDYHGNNKRNNTNEKEISTFKILETNDKDSEQVKDKNLTGSECVEKTLLFKSICFQLLRSINYLHDNKVIHRDLKPSNIMISKEGEVKLIDFDLIYKTDSEESELVPSNLATLLYMPPENFLNKNTNYFGIDLWSLGCVFAEMYLSFPIFKEEGSLGVLSKICNTLGFKRDQLDSSFSLIKSHIKFNDKKSDNYHFDKLFGSCEDPFRYLLKSLLQLDPNLRMSANIAISSEYFGDLDYESTKINIKNYLKDYLK